MTKVYHLVQEFRVRGEGFMSILASTTLQHVSISVRVTWHFSGHSCSAQTFFSIVSMSSGIIFILVLGCAILQQPFYLLLVQFSLFILRFKNDLLLDFSESPESIL